MSDVDLSALRIDPTAADVSARRPLGPRLWTAVLVVVALAVALTFAWPLLRPVREVTTAPVQAWKGELAPGQVAPRTGGGTEAVGWIEADPFGVEVRPLVRGRIETLLVLEGAEVRADETVIGTLASAELQAAAERASAQVAERVAELARIQAEVDQAAALLEQNAEARLRLRAAQIAAAVVETQLGTAREELQRARAMASSSQAAAEAQEQLAAAGSAYPVALQRARAEAAAATASVGAAEQQVLGLTAQREAQARQVALCEELVRAPSALSTGLQVARGRAEQASAALQQARVAKAIADRELGWAEVRAPVDGVVLRLDAQPGATVGPEGLSLVTLYDPARLRARIDVPIDSLAGLREGQDVEIRSEALGEQVVRGVVQRLQHEADLLKNTLQVKVGLFDPPRLLRPETLCRARFLESQPSGDREDDPAGGGGPGTDRAASVFVVPTVALRDGAVFVLDPRDARARRVTVEQVGSDGERVLVRGALSPTQRVVLDAVRAGERVREIER